MDRAVGAAAGLATSALAIGAVQAQDLDMLHFLFGGISFVAMGLVGIRHFVRSEIREHSESEARIDTERHRAILTHLAALTQRLEDRGVLPPSFVVARAEVEAATTGEYPREEPGA